MKRSTSGTEGPVPPRAVSSDRWRMSNCTTFAQWILTLAAEIAANINLQVLKEWQARQEQRQHREN